MTADTSDIMPALHAADNSSPTCRRLDTVIGTITPTRRRKRVRTEVTQSSADARILIPESTGEEASISPHQPPLSPPPPPSLLQTTSHLSLIQQEAHLNRLELQKGMDQGKGTDEAYPRHVRNYVQFWEADQHRRQEEDPTYERVPAHPIVAEKVAIFLKSETTRNKRNNRGVEISGTSVGKESIKQTISALQRYMLEHQHEPEYFNCPDTRVPLRSQDMVKIFETTSCANEPKRIQEAHILKAKGTINDTYSVDEIKRMSTWALQSFGPKKSQIHIGIRDRAMLLLSTTIGFRGNSTRLALFSDLFFRMIPMGNIGPDIRLQTLGIMADQSKTNVAGRVDEHGMFRHRIPELCGFAGIGFYFFSYFHILKKPVPTFSPDFDDANHSEFGRRDWYRLLLFPGKAKPAKDSEGVESEAMPDDGTSPMTYDNHYERVSLMHKRNSISVSAVTHAGRPYTAIVAREHGAAAIDTKVLGRWKTGDAYSEIYDRGLPCNAMLAAAMFNVENPESYVLARALLDPPEQLHAMIFPWVEDELAAYEARLNRYGPKATDFSLKNFLALLIEFRSVLLQDAAVLYQTYPDFKIWNYRPFNTPLFQSFSQQSVEIMENAEAVARHHLESLPHTVSRSMQGILQTIAIQRAQDEAQRAKDQSEMTTHMNFFHGLMINHISSKSKGKKHSRDLDLRLPYHSNTVAPGTSSSYAASSITQPYTQPVAFSTTIPSPDCDTVAPSKSIDIISDAAPINMVGPATDAELKLSVWPADLKMYQYNFVLSKADDERVRQLISIRDLLAKYGNTPISKHQFEWTRYATGRVTEEWLPVYVYQKGLSVCEMWQEWADGLGGSFSVWQLCENWDARWRHNVQGQKTEASRRKHVIDLITELSAKPKWSVTLALRFLEEMYPIPGAGYLASATTFCKELQNKTKGPILRKEILDNALQYCK